MTKSISLSEVFHRTFLNPLMFLFHFCCPRYCISISEHRQREIRGKANLKQDGRNRTETDTKDKSIGNVWKELASATEGT